MKMLIIAGLTITLPAIVLVIIFFGREMMLPALASLCINAVPFTLAGLLLRKHNAADEIGH